MHKENLLKPQESDVGEEMDGVDATTLEAHEQQGLPTVKDVIMDMSGYMSQTLNVGYISGYIYHYYPLFTQISYLNYPNVAR